MMASSDPIKLIEDVRDISAITYGFMASKALFAALDFDLFTQIETGISSAAALASATGIAENRVVTLLAALKSLGLIAERDGRLSNAPATSKFLVAGAPGDFRDYVRLVNGAFGFESFRNLSPALRGERVFPDKGFYEGLIYSAGIRRGAVQCGPAFWIARPGAPDGKACRSRRQDPIARRRRR